jgi:hypothetical protein
MCPSFVKVLNGRVRTLVRSGHRITLDPGARCIAEVTYSAPCTVAQSGLAYSDTCPYCQRHCRSCSCSCSHEPKSREGSTPPPSPMPIPVVSPSLPSSFPMTHGITCVPRQPSSLSPRDPSLSTISTKSQLHGLFDGHRVIVLASHVVSISSS